MAPRKHHLPGTDQPWRGRACGKACGGQLPLLVAEKSNGDIKRVLTIAYFDRLGVPRLS
jgi:hypothetical protein